MSAPRDILTNTHFCRELDALLMMHNNGKPVGMVLIIADTEEQAMVCNVKEKEAVMHMLRGALKEAKERPEGQMSIDLKRPVS